jgi:hypothetical protein
MYDTTPFIYTTWCLVKYRGHLYAILSKCIRCYWRNNCVPELSFSQAPSTAGPCSASQHNVWTRWLGVRFELSLWWRCRCRSLGCDVMYWIVCRWLPTLQRNVSPTFHCNPLDGGSMFPCYQVPTRLHDVTNQKTTTERTDLSVCGSVLVITFLLSRRSWAALWIMILHGCD